MSTALRRLVFQPTPNRLFAGQEEEVRFHLVLDDQQGQGTVENDESSVIVQSLNDPPQIALNVTNSIIADIGAGDIKPFRATTIVDPDAGSQTLTVTILVDTPSKGSFSSLGGFTNLPAYTFIGTASEATASIQNLIFNPNRGFGGLSGSASKQVSFAINARDDRNGLAVTFSLSRKNRCGKIQLWSLPHWAGQSS